MRDPPPATAFRDREAVKGSLSSLRSWSSPDLYVLASEGDKRVATTPLKIVTASTPPVEKRPLSRQTSRIPLPSPTVARSRSNSAAAQRGQTPQPSPLPTPSTLTNPSRQRSKSASAPRPSVSAIANVNVNARSDFGKRSPSNGPPQQLTALRITEKHAQMIEAISKVGRASIVIRGGSVAGPVEQDMRRSVTASSAPLPQPPPASPTTQSRRTTTVTRPSITTRTIQPPQSPHAMITPLPSPTIGGERYRKLAVLVRRVEALEARSRRQERTINELTRDLRSMKANPPQVVHQQRQQTATATVQGGGRKVRGKAKPSGPGDLRAMEMRVAALRRELVEAQRALDGASGKIGGVVVVGGVLCDVDGQGVAGGGWSSGGNGSLAASGSLEL